MSVNYKHKISIQIRFVDIDRLNHVNNACYLSFFELGRVKYFNEVLGDVIDWNKNGFVLARTEIDHLEPIFLNDEVFCYTKVSKLGSKSLVVENSLVKLVKGKSLECARGLGILVAMNYLSNKSIPIPKKWRNKLEKFESLK